jgi:transposase
MNAYTIKDFQIQFSNEDSCLDFLFRSRWPGGAFCSKCAKTTPHYRIRAKRAYSCQFCGSLVSPTAGTIFHKSATALTSWFHSIFLMASTRTGISAKHLQRELGVTYKTAWRMMSQIRKLLAEDDTFLMGQIEADETYMGGRDKNRHESKRSHRRGRGAGGKTPVVGLVERGGPAVVKVTPDVKATTLLPIIERHAVLKHRTTIYTDELMSYRRLTMMGYRHETVAHVAKQYVHGVAHVNNVESLWSTIKRGIDGVHHSVSPQHLQSYLDSYVFRYNHRHSETPMFLEMMYRIRECLAQ